MSNTIYQLSDGNKIAFKSLPIIRLYLRSTSIGCVPWLLLKEPWRKNEYLFSLIHSFHIWIPERFATFKTSLPPWFSLAGKSDLPCQPHTVPSSRGSTKPGGTQSSEGCSCVSQPQAKFSMPIQRQSPKIAPPNHRSTRRGWNHPGWGYTRWRFRADQHPAPFICIYSSLFFLVLALTSPLLLPMALPGSEDPLWTWAGHREYSWDPMQIFPLQHQDLRCREPFWTH